jgi:hypothetical protein
MKKKVLVMLLSALVVLSIGQAAFAGSKAGLTAGYVYVDEFKINGFGFEVFGEYQFSKLFSLGGDVSMAFLDGLIEGNASLMGKFNVYSNDLFNVGALLNVSTKYYVYSALGFNELLVGPGIYGEVNLIDKLTISAAAKFTLLVIELYGSNDASFVFRPTSIQLGVSYGITDNIAIGVKGIYERAYGDLNVFSVGVTAEYKF